MYDIRQEGSFDWDAANLHHISRHDVTRQEAEQALESATVDLGWQTSEDEERLVQVGQTASGRILTVVTTARGNRIRIVTAFDASPGFRSLYLKYMEGKAP